MVALDDRQVAEKTRSVGLVQRILEGVKYLSAEDQRVVHMLAGGQLSQKEVAQLLGISQSALCRRIRRIWEKLNDPLVKALIANRQGLRAEYWQLGIEHFLHGMSGPELAGKHGMPACQVRRALVMVRGWFNGRQSWGRDVSC